MRDIIRRVIVHGKVQGVGFRAWTQYKASQRGLNGWVRNRRDGTVEAVFAGPMEVVEVMVADCGRGPRLSQVTQVDRFDSSEAELGLRGPERGFTELPTL
jgi:acylphosphatase